MGWRGDREDKRLLLHPSVFFKRSRDGNPFLPDSMLLNNDAERFPAHRDDEQNYAASLPLCPDCNGTGRDGLADCGRCAGFGLSK